MLERQDKIFWRIPEWFPGLGDEAVSKLETYHKELLKFNRKINLISANTVRAADLFHFSDSLLGGRLILDDCKSKEIFDFGSGNGFPGLVMAIVDPTRHFFLIESDHRKVEFLKHTIDILGLKHAAVFLKRVEELPQNQIVAGVCRGFANIPRALLVTRKLFPPGGKFYHFKGGEWITELGAMPHQICIHWETIHTGDYVLPEENIKLTIIKSQRITPLGVKENS